MILSHHFCFLIEIIAVEVFSTKVVEDSDATVFNPLRISTQDAQNEYFGYDLFSL